MVKELGQYIILSCILHYYFFCRPTIILSTKCNPTSVVNDKSDSLLCVTASLSHSHLCSALSLHCFFWVLICLIGCCLLLYIHVEFFSEVVWNNTDGILDCSGATSKIWHYKYNYFLNWIKQSALLLDFHCLAHSARWCAC